MSDPHDIACAAARAATEILGLDVDQGPMLQFHGHHTILSVALHSVEQALALADSTPAFASSALTVVADSYYARVDVNDEQQAAEAADDIGRGELADRYQIGDPTIVDAITVVTVDRHAARMTVMPYRRADDPPSITWSEAVEHDQVPWPELSGRVPEALMAALTGHPSVMLSTVEERALFSELTDMLRASGIPADMLPL